MDKIYSRFRLPKIIYTPENNKKNKKVNQKYKNFLVLMIVAIIIAYATAINIINSINPMLERQSRVLARSTAAKLSNEASKEAMKDLTYQDLCIVDKDENGNVTMMKLNVTNVNKVTTQIALDIQNALNERTNNSFYIRIGSLTSSKLLAGRGPNIELRMLTAGDIQTNIRSDFTEAGINQTLHKIYMDIDCKISVLTPYKDTDEEVKTEVLLAEAVIVGKIPETYYNLNGLSKDDTMNLMGN